MDVCLFDVVWDAPYDGGMTSPESESKARQKLAQILDEGRKLYGTRSLQEAEQAFQQGLEVSREIGDDFLIAEMLVQLGRTYQAQRHSNLAVQYLGEGIAKLDQKKREHQSLLGASHRFLGEAYVDLHLETEAKKHFDISSLLYQEVYETSGFNPVYLAPSHLARSRALELIGDGQGAIEELQAAIQAWTEAGNQEAVEYYKQRMKELERGE